MNFQLTLQSCPEGIVGFFCRYKDIAQFILLFIAIVTAAIASKNLKNSIDQRSFKEGIDLHQNVFALIQTYRKESIKSDPDKREIYRGLIETLNMFEFIGTATNKKILTRTISEDIFYLLVMTLMHIIEVESIKNCTEKDIFEDSYPDLKIWILNNHSRISPSRAMQLYTLVFKGDSDKIMKKGISGFFIRYIYILNLKRVSRPY